MIASQSWGDCENGVKREFDIIQATQVISVNYDTVKCKGSLRRRFHASHSQIKRSWVTE